jgi:hypothetical protein
MAPLQDALANLSPGSKGLAATMITSYLLQFMFPAIKSFFGLAAGKTILMPWQVVTSGLLQDSLIGVRVSLRLKASQTCISCKLTNLISFNFFLRPSLQLITYVLAILFLSRPVEAVQGQPGFLKSILISIGVSGGLTFFLVTFIYYIQAVTMAGTAAGDNAGDILYDPICGFQGGLAALLVGVKQAIPDKDITMLSSFQFKTKDLPGVYLVAILIWGIITGSTLKLLPFALFASYTAWFYLRFFAYRADSFLRGDPSPEFSFASFFPAAAQPVANQIAKVCLNVTKLDAMLAADAQNVKQSSALLIGRASPSKDTFEANRRR